MSGSSDLISVRYDGFDITDHVELRHSTFQTGVNARPGPCTVRIRDKARTELFATGKSLSLDINGQRKWDGFVTEIKRGYYFNGMTSLSEAARYIELLGTDANILFEKRFLFDHNQPTLIDLKQYPAGTHDDVVLLYYMQNYLDLRDDFITRFAIEHVGTPALDCADNHDCIGGSAGWSWGDFMREMSRNIGSIFYIDPDRAVIYTDTDSPDALLGISDTPGAGEVGCQNLEIEYGGEELRNDAMIWGAGQGSDHMVFSRVQDSASQATHGRWQYGDFRTSIFRQATVDKIANSAVYGSPQNKRGGKDDRVSVRCRVFEHSFRVAQKVRVRSEVFGYDDVLPIRVMDITFPTPDQAVYDLQLSQEIDPIWATFEFWFPQLDIKATPVITPTPPTITSGVTQGPGGVVVIEAPCHGGTIEYNELGLPGAYSMIVTMFPTGYSNPSYPPIGPQSYLGTAWYILDGDPSTYLVGYWAWARGEITWDMRIPLPVAGATVEQCIGAPNDMVIGLYNGPFDGWRHMSNRLKLYADGVLVGDTGDLGSGPIYDITVVNDSPSTLARYWTVVSDGATAEYYIGQGLEFGMRGEYGLGWWVNQVSMTAYCQTANSGTGSPPPVAGPGGDIPQPGSTVPGSPGARCYYVHTAYWPGSSQLWLGGLFLRPGIDYFEYPKRGAFCLRDDLVITGAQLYFRAIFVPIIKVEP